MNQISHTVYTLMAKRNELKCGSQRVKEGFVESACGELDVAVIMSVRCM